ncbi:MAG: hypothetical protein PF495_12735 [Spirochaetales bacterium]|jgi:hypothetical protein|nr:hypothetical protein [Spirochaetales bacterium]
MEISRQSVCDAFNIRLKSLFPDSFVNCRVRNILGECIGFTFALYQKGDWINGIIENDPAFMTFLTHENRDGSVEIERPGTHRSVLKNAGIKFRKIKGKDEAEAMSKLAAWFEKNADAIRSLKS